MSTEYAVPVEDAMTRLAVVEGYDAGDGPERCVHTFVQSGFGLVGAHWSVSEAERAFREYGVEGAGEQACAMRHGLVVPNYKGRGPVFFETKDETAA